MQQRRESREAQQHRENKRLADGARRQGEHENNQIRGRAAGVPNWVPSRHAAVSHGNLLPLRLVLMANIPKGSSLLMGSLKDR
jgi:hypothetical protein